MVKAEVFGPGSYDSCANKVKTLTGALLIFHPGCGHCIQMRSEWEAMKRRLSPGTRVMEVDGSEMDEHENLKSKLPPIQGFPTFILMRKGRPIGQFKGQRTSEEMANFTENGLNTNENKRSVKRVRMTKRKKNRRKSMKKKKM